MNARKILIAVDASENAMRAVEYAGKVVGGAPGFEVHLLCIEQLPSRDLFADDEAWQAVCTETRRELKEFLGKARLRLEGLGAPDGSVFEDYVAFCHSPFNESAARCSRGTSIALEILETVKSGGFGTVVVGRRGLSKAEEFLFGSVSNKIVHSARDCTVWVVS
ncbi:universal stress protein [Salidesulfovibrio brasiliensis]